MYVLQYWLNPRTRWWYHSLPSVRWSFVIAVSMMLAFLLRIDKFSENRFFRPPPTKWLILNAMMLVLISNWAVWPTMHDRFVQDHIKLLVFIGIAYKVIDSPLKFERLMLTNIAGAFYVSYETKKKGRNMFGRVEGTGPADSGGDANKTAASLISVLPVLVFFTIRSFVQKDDIWKRFLFLLFSAYTFNAIVLINSRGSFVGLALSFLYFGFRAWTHKLITWKHRFQMVFLVFLGIAGFLYLADDAFWERIASISEESESDDGGGGRKLFWSIAWDLAKVYPWGAGGWGFRYLSPQYVPAEFFPKNGGMRAEHSLYFQCLVERGYLGATIWFIMFFSCFLFMQKARSFLLSSKMNPEYFLGIAIESGAIAFMVAAAFINVLNAEMLYWQVLFMVSYGNIYFLKNINSSKAMEGSF